MFDLFLKPKFYSKSKSALRVNKVRLETIKKKRNTVEKYLKKDIADLLKNRLDYNAYGRTEGLLIEQTRTACYKFIEQFSECISKHLSAMQKQSECPEECREAVPSLIYAAARFSDLPELRTLRMLFTEKYGDSLEPYLNQEFVQKIQAEPPTKEMKLQLMHAIAKEFSIQWDSKALEQKLFTPPPPEQNEVRHKSLNDADDNEYKSHRSKNGASNITEDTRTKTNETDHTPRTRKEVVDDKPKQHSSSYRSEGAFEKSNNHDENGSSYLQEYRRPKRNEKGLTSSASNDIVDDKKLLHSSEGESIDRGILKTSSTSEASVPDDVKENSKPFYYRFVPPPYVKPPVDISNEKSSVEEPKTPSRNIDTEKIDKPNDPTVENKPKPRSVRSRRPLKLPPGRENPGLQSAKSDPSSPPASAPSFQNGVSSPTKTEGRNTQASSFERDIFTEPVPRKLPDYDSLRTRLGAQRGRRNYH